MECPVQQRSGRKRNSATCGNMAAQAGPSGTQPFSNVWSGGSVALSDPRNVDRSPKPARIKYCVPGIRTEFPFPPNSHRINCRCLVAHARTSGIFQRRGTPACWFRSRQRLFCDWIQRTPKCTSMVCRNGDRRNLDRVLSFFCQSDVDRGGTPHPQSSPNRGRTRRGLPSAAPRQRIQRIQRQGTSQGWRQSTMQLRVRKL